MRCWGEPARERKPTTETMIVRVLATVTADAQQTQISEPVSSARRNGTDVMHMHPGDTPPVARQLNLAGRYTAVLAPPHRALEHRGPAPLPIRWIRGPEPEDGLHDAAPEERGDRGTHDVKRMHKEILCSLYLEY